VLAPADAGATVRVAVTGTDGDGTQTVASAATATVTPAPTATAAATTSPAAPTTSVTRTPVLELPLLLSAPRLGGAPVRVGARLRLITAAWGGAATATHLQDWRCTSVCVAVAGSDTLAYPLTAADAGAMVGVAETASGPAGTRTAWTWAGPVASVRSGAATVASGAAKTLRTVVHGALARVRVGKVRGNAVTVVLTRAAGVRGTLKAWACPTPVDEIRMRTCASLVTLGRRGALTMPLASGQRVQVVVRRG
jgi:hypothetical protein